MNGLELSIQTVFGIFDVLAMLFLSLALYRIPYRSYFYEMGIMSVIISIIQTIGYDVIQWHFMYNELLLVFSTFVLLMMLCKTTVWHSFLLTISGYVMTNLFFGLYGFFIELSGIYTVEDMLHNTPVTCTVQFTQFVVAYVLSQLFYKKGLGFMLIAKSMSFKPEIKRLNMLIITTTLLCFVVVEIAIELVAYHRVKVFMPLIIVIIFFNSALWAIYMRSNKELEQYYEKQDLTKFMP
ncbi:hypothetical protein [Priestia abyssalis]|uniref:hypothetical protein n=1 Tax=Priestia abyssalis TaxID=1221450 RepID=UPI0009949A94|nr:hypothetical protein [Priestia abyssalis]